MSLEFPPVIQKISVRYQDLDPYGHVNNAVHLEYFESARIAYLNTLTGRAGLGPLNAGDVPGMYYVIAEANIRYKPRSTSKTPSIAPRASAPSATAPSS